MAIFLFIPVPGLQDVHALFQGLADTGSGFVGRPIRQVYAIALMLIVIEQSLAECSKTYFQFYNKQKDVVMQVRVE